MAEALGLELGKDWPVPQRANIEGSCPRPADGRKRPNPRWCKWSGERAGIRTLDLLIKSQLLYRLSYAL